jgi:hypothetical protein
VHVQHVELALPKFSRAIDPLYGTGTARPAGTT